MAVLLADRTLGVKYRAALTTVDAHGANVPINESDIAGPWPGKVRLVTDGTVVISVDPQAWPLRPRDIVVDTTTGQEWVVRDATLARNPVDSSVDFVRVTGLGRDGEGSSRPADTYATNVGPATG